MYATFDLYHRGQILTSCRMPENATDNQVRAHVLNQFDSHPGVFTGMGQAPYQVRARLLVAQVRRVDA